MSNQQTDNSRIAEKILIREAFLPDKDILTVLDVYCGKGVIWNTLAARNKNKKFRVIGLDKKNVEDRIYLKGDNVKYLAAMDLNRFDIIDLDAYRIPYEPLLQIFQKTLTRPIEIFCTVIFGQFGGIHSGLLEEIGYTKKMVKKCPALFMRKGLISVMEWLAIRGVPKVDVMSLKNDRRNQIHFQWGKS